MDVICFCPGEGVSPLYRTVSPAETSMLRALLGAGFVFPLVDGEPMDDLLFDVLGPAGMSARFYFSCPEGANLLGTFELSDGQADTPLSGIRSREH